MWRKLLILIAITLIGSSFFGVPGAMAQEKSYSADRFDVDVVVQEDGSLHVTETVVFSFVGEPFTFVFRELPTEMTDGINILAAAVDGRMYPRGDQAGQVEIDAGRDIRVTWHLEPTANATRTFVLEYQMLGVVRQAEGADLLRYQPLPDDFEYSIANSSVTLHYPASANLLETPSVPVGEAQVDRNGAVVTFTRQNIAANDTLVVELTFAEGSLISAPPAWQARRAEQNALAPIWVGLGLIILTAGSLGALWIWRSNQPKAVKGTAVQYEPPNHLPPAIAGVLNAHGAKPSWTNALATLFDLADRGILSIEEVATKKWYQGQDFTIVQQIASPSGLLPHEIGLLDLIFDSKNGRETAVKLSKLSDQVSGRQWKKFTDPLEEELKAAGYIDKTRQTRRQRMMASSFIFLVLGAIALVGMPIGLIDRFGGWPIAIAFSFLILFGVWMTTGNVLTILTNEAKQMADEWQRFYEYMRDVTQKKAAVSGANMFQEFLPYAASYGLVHQWAKFFQKQGWTDLPPYFHAASLAGGDGDRMAAFVAMTSASSSSGGSAAGAGGAAGAAGGGASGAG